MRRFTYTMFAAFTLLGACADDGPSAPVVTAETEQAIHAAVLDSLFLRGESGRPQQLVVLDSTEVFDRETITAMDGHLDALAGLDPTTRRSFEARAPTLRPVAAPSGLGVPVRMVGWRDLNTLPQDIFVYWQAFYARYPGSPGYVVLSAAGISDAGDQALVVVHHGCGNLCAEGRLVLLRRVGGSWRVTEAVTIWVS